MIDWSALTPREIRRAAATMPMVATPWRHGERSDGSRAINQWHARIASAYALHDTWSGQVGYGFSLRVPNGAWERKGGVYATEAEARAYADAELERAGWVLDNDKTEDDWRYPDRLRGAVGACGIVTGRKEPAT